MTSRPRGRYAKTALLSICTTAFVAVMCSVAIGSPWPTLLPQDSFTGRIAFATGKLTGDRGEVAILLKTGHSVATRRQLTLVLDGRRCGKAKHCVQLTGVLTGMLIAEPTLPDMGRRFTIAAEGFIQPLGQVSATGSVRGTGFIFSYGHEPLHLTLNAPTGRVTIDAKSGKVPPFTSP
jgi:hypothetical protein